MYRGVSLACWLASLVGALGCTQSLDVGSHEDASVDASGSDGGITDAAMRADGAVADAIVSGDGAADSCASGPTLVVALRSSEPTHIDSVLARFAVSADGVTRCPDVTASGGLPAIGVVGWIDAQRLVIGSYEGVWVVDAAADRIVGERYFLDTGNRPIDAFGLRDASGETWGVVGTDFRPDDAIDRFFLVRSSDLSVRIVEDVDVDTRRLSSCDASSADSAAMVCVENIVRAPPYGTEAAAKELYPFTRAPAVPWIAPVHGTTFSRIDVLDDRIAWITRSASVDEVRGSVDGRRGSVGGPTRCTTPLCSEPRELVDLVVDPTRPGGYFAICQGVNDLRTPSHVIRGSTEADGAACEVIVDGTTLPNGVDPTALDLRAP